MVAMSKRPPIIAAALADLPHLPITSLTPLQGDLKDLSAREYQKLKKSLTEFGIIVPFFVWRQTSQLIDGHQRLRLFEREGWQIDVPVVFIDAETEDEAKKRLLVVSSQYGRVTQEGWDNFTFNLDPDWLMSTAQFDALPLVFSGFRPSEPANDPYEEWDSMPEFTGEDKTSYQSIHVHFKNAEEVAEFAAIIGQSLTEKTRSIWYSQRERMDYGDEYYTS